MNASSYRSDRTARPYASRIAIRYSEGKNLTLLTITLLTINLLTATLNLILTQTLPYS